MSHFHLISLSRYLFPGIVFMFCVTTWTIAQSNHPPVANAGPDQTVNIGGAFTLDGSASSDPDQDVLTYTWTVAASLPGGNGGSGVVIVRHSTSFLAEGGTISYEGNNTIHTFTSSGTFSSDYSGYVEVLVVGGGGGGGCHLAGGGGGGGVIYNPNYFAKEKIPVTVGAGGKGSANIEVSGLNGLDSKFGSMTAIGGGGGASRFTDAGNGGSGGGGSPEKLGNSFGNGTPGQGHNGGVGGDYWNYLGGGGGGAGSVGSGGTGSGGNGNGGFGAAFSITGSNVFYGGGGGAGAYGTNLPGMGSAGGGKGSNAYFVAANGMPSTGGGGGGGGLSYAGIPTLGAGAHLTVELTEGYQTIILTVNDGKGGSSSDTVLVTVGGVVNHSPLANAGADKTVTLINDSTAQIVLDGTASYDPDGDGLLYLWKEDTVILGTSVQSNVALPLGKHLITLTVNDGNHGTSTDTVVITIVTAPLISILSILDVPNDQGKQVEIVWRNFEKESITSFMVTSYNVWRMNSGVWTHLWEIPSRNDSILSVIVPTLYDSTKTEGIHWSVFQITAHNTNSSQVAYTPVDSGYSIDNLAPSVPGGVVAAIQNNNIILSWKPSTDKDFQYFAVYRSTKSEFDPKSIAAYQTVIDTNFIDTGVVAGVTYYYRISTFDFSGNESPYSPEISTSITTVVKFGTEAPKEFKLMQNYPNPFNPTTNIEFAVPSTGHAKLEIIGVLGQKVSTLFNGEAEPGKYHKVQFDGRRLTSGMYFARLEYNGNVLVKKILLLK